MSKFGTLITAIISPFKADNAYALDLAAAERLVEHLVETGTDTIVVAGTTGESPTLTHDEEMELLKAVIAKCKSLGKGTKVIFGAGSNCTLTAIESSQRAEKIGADGLLVVTPYYNKPNQKGLIEHYSQIAAKTCLPIILYNIPGRCVIDMKAETIIQLAKAHSNIVALKEASNNIDQVSRIRQELSAAEFQIYSGDDSLTLPMMAVGAQGVVSVASHFVGSEMKTMIQAFAEGKTKEADTIHRKLFPLFNALFVEPNPTCTKAGLAIIGVCSEQLRSPLVPLTPEQRKSLEQLIKSLGIKARVAA